LLPPAQLAEATRMREDKQSSAKNAKYSSLMLSDTVWLWTAIATKRAHTPTMATIAGAGLELLAEAQEE